MERARTSVVGVAALAVALVLLPALGALALAATGDAWFPWLSTRPAVWTAVVLLVSTALLAGTSLIPTHAASLVCGLCFGPTVGPGVALLSVGAAAWVGFTLLRTLVGDRVLHALATRPRAEAVHRALLRRDPNRTTSTIVLLRLSPVMPFAGTNLLLAASGVPLRPFLLGSMLGLAPRVILVAIAGAQLGTLDWNRPQNHTTTILGIAATLLGMIWIGRVGGRAWRAHLPPPPA